jgi:hypothetical protein
MNCLASASRSLVVLTCVSLVVACGAPPKSVGNETDSTDTDGESTAAEASESGPGSSPTGDSTNGTTAGTTNGTTAGTTAGSATTSASEDSTGTDGSESVGESGSESTGTVGELPEGWEETLDSRGCGDMTIYAVNADDTLVLVTTIYAEMVAAAAESDDDPLEFVVDVADFERFHVDVGYNLESDLCTDAVDQPPVVEATWTAISGTATFSVSSGPDPEFNGGADATVTFTDVVLENDGVQVPMQTLTFTDVSVGWLPG